MRIREIKEIKNREIRKVKEEEGYKKIKPETDITYEEAVEFWRLEFDRIAREANNN